MSMTYKLCVCGTADCPLQKGVELSYSITVSAACPRRATLKCDFQGWSRGWTLTCIFVGEQCVLLQRTRTGRGYGSVSSRAIKVFTKGDMREGGVAWEATQEVIAAGGWGKDKTVKGRPLNLGETMTAMWFLEYIPELCMIGHSALLLVLRHFELGRHTAMGRGHLRLQARARGKGDREALGKCPA